MNELYELYTLIDGEWIKAFTQTWVPVQDPTFPVTAEMLERMSGIKCAVLAEHLMLEVADVTEAKCQAVKQFVAGVAS